MASPLVRHDRQDSPNPFDHTPFELLQRIATFIEYDSDICSFRLICRSTRDAVDADKNSFWRKRFLSLFERPATSLVGEEGNLVFKKTYQRRRSVLKHGADFVIGESARERACLEVLRDMIVGMFL